ncbi:FAS-associated death domain [Paramuricea clavata]|uniref:FAS-associated death domain n=1 Tax=Paramuricea clavata TaxID=317549 RepID=A0A7D9DCJ3_PARCT|nr:FAS-associated death domain [Paramuricea clavata]
MDSFRLLLNEISHQLTDDNLRSLIHIYNVPGGIRRNMNDGLALFDYMITQDYISREKIGNLRNLIRKLRPRRKDLVRVVDNYIKKEFQTDDVRLVLDDFSESWEQIPLVNKSGSPVLYDETGVCKIDCGYLNCVCRRVPSCYTPIIVLLLIAIIATIVFRNDVQHISDSIKVFIITLEILALLLVIGFCIRGNLASQKPNNTVLVNPVVNPGIQEGLSRQIVNSASAGQLQRMATAPRSYKTSESAIFSDASGEPNSLSTFGTFEPMDELPDSSGPEH